MKGGMKCSIITLTPEWKRSFQANNGELNLGQLWRRLWIESHTYMSSPQ